MKTAERADARAATAIATLRNKIGNGESSYFGGVFFARADNDQVRLNSIKIHDPVKARPTEIVVKVPKPANIPDTTVALNTGPQVNTLADIQGRIVETSSIFLSGSVQAQWEELRRNGLDLFVGPAQVARGATQTPLLASVIVPHPSSPETRPFRSHHGRQWPSISASGRRLASEPAVAPGGRGALVTSPESPKPSLKS